MLLVRYTNADNSVFSKMRPSVKVMLRLAETGLEVRTPVSKSSCQSLEHTSLYSTLCSVSAQPLLALPSLQGSCYSSRLPMIWCGASTHLPPGPTDTSFFHSFPWSPHGTLNPHSQGLRQFVWWEVCYLSMSSPGTRTPTGLITPTSPCYFP